MGVGKRGHALAEQLRDLPWKNEIRAGLILDVLENSPGGSVRDRLSPVNTQCRIDRCGNIFDVDGPLLVPAGISDLSPDCVGCADCTSTLDAGSGKEPGESMFMVVAPLVHRQLTGGPSKLSETTDQRFLQFATGFK